MDAGNIVGHHVDFEIIKTFQQLDPRYCAKKFQKLEQRFTTPPQDNIPIIVTRKPPKTTTVTKVETKTSIFFLHDDDENE